MAQTGRYWITFFVLMIAFQIGVRALASWWGMGPLLAVAGPIMAYGLLVSVLHALRRREERPRAERLGRMRGGDTVETDYLLHTVATRDGDIGRVLRAVVDLLDARLPAGGTVGVAATSDARERAFRAAGFELATGSTAVMIYTCGTSSDREQHSGDRLVEGP